MPLLLLNTCGTQAIIALATPAVLATPAALATPVALATPAALAGQTGLLAEEILPLRHTSEALLPAIRRVLGTLPLTQLEAIVVVTGPGSFTGVRVGLAAAKGLAEAATLPLICLSRLQLLADAYPDRTPLLDGGRNEFYTLQQGTELLLPQSQIQIQSQSSLITCEPRVLEAFPHALLVPEPAGLALLAAALPTLAARAFTDPALADANYIRRTDAELKQSRPTPPFPS